MNADIGGSIFLLVLALIVVGLVVWFLRRPVSSPNDHEEHHTADDGIADQGKVMGPNRRVRPR